MSFGLEILEEVEISLVFLLHLGVLLAHSFALRVVLLVSRLQVWTVPDPHAGVLCGSPHPHHHFLSRAVLDRSPTRKQGRTSTATRVGSCQSLRSRGE